MNITELSTPSAYSIRIGGKQYYAVDPEVLVDNRYLQAIAAGENFQLLFPSLGDIYKYATMDKVLHSALAMIDTASVRLELPRKYPLYYVEELFPDSVIVRLPHNNSEKTFIQQIGKPLLVFALPELQSDLFIIEKGYIVDAESKGLISFAEEGLHVKNGNEDSLRLVTYYDEVKKNKAFRYADKFPLFRQPFISIFWGSKQEAVELILQRIQQRFQEKRSMNLIKPALVATPNLDHLRMLIEENDPEFRNVYAQSFLQVADGYPPLVKFAKQSIGYQTKEQVDGVSLFMSIMNRIGQEDLPFTVYLVGGWQGTANKVKEHFVSSYPHFAGKIVGISAPPMGILKDEKVYSAVAEDINKKQPDFVFVCLAAPTQEKFVHKLRKDGVNFGLGFGLGRTFDLISGYQKKEPKLIENLRLVWLYRAFTKKTYATRAIKGLQFAFKSFIKG